MDKISEYRKQKSYRLLESSIGTVSITSMILVIITTFINPTFGALFLIIFSFLWVLKYTLNVIYTLFSYIRLHRWEQLDWGNFLNILEDKPSTAIDILTKFQQKYSNKINWTSEIESYKKGIRKIQNTKFEKPTNIYQFTTFSIYNEPAEVLKKSLYCLYQSKYPLEKLCVFVSQEERAGIKINKAVMDYVKKLDWVEIHDFTEKNKKIVYANHKKLSYTNNKNIKLNNTKLNVFFTQHPDGLVGEIKGKASNEDWGTRQSSLFAKSQNIDPDMVLVTSLDADSHIGEYFFHHLVLRYITSENKLQSGFQPVHVYSNNFFDVHLIPRLVATQTALFNLTNLSISGETPFFAIYSLSMATLHEVNFWIKDVIAEDAMLFNKCLVHFDANFHVYPFYGIFEGDAVEGDTFLEAIISQYKQLQRWAWGGVEDFPYIFHNFFLTEKGSKIDLRVRLRWVYLKFTNHLFWSAAPLIFSLGLFLPKLAGDPNFEQNPASQNLATFSSYFSWTSFIFIFTFGYITLKYFAVKATKGKKLTLWQIAIVILQFALSPFVFGIMGIPALDAQIRGIRGKYLGYWVTPKN
jgi:hypothetical protein